MRKDQVPQDDSFLEGHRKATYAVGEGGRYEVVPSRGYEPERIATAVALEERDRQVRLAWEAAASGRRSPLAYHLAARQLTARRFARQAGVLSLAVLWHLRPAGFRRMRPATALRYSASLGLSPDELARLPPRPELMLDPVDHG